MHTSNHHGAPVWDRDRACPGRALERHPHRPDMQDQRYADQPPLEADESEIVLHGQQIRAYHPPVEPQAAADRRDDVRPSNIGEQFAALQHSQAHDVRVRIDESVYRFRDRVGRFSDRSISRAFALPGSRR